MVKKNTGPLSPEAKLRVSRNAISHGISSRLPVVNAFESQEVWDYHLNGVLESLKPESYLEVFLAERIAIILWRLDRVVYHETQLIGFRSEGVQDKVIADAHMMQKHANMPIEQQPLGEVMVHHWIDRILPEGDDLDRIKKYEAHLHRLWVQTLHEFEALQTRRQGGDAPLARLDVSGTRE
ncbi:MAG: hypothetical protein WD904_10960 [Dehalococcoidia bacterium]